MYRLFRKKYAVLIGYGNSFFWSWKSHGKSLLKKSGHPAASMLVRCVCLSWCLCVIVCLLPDHWSQFSSDLHQTLQTARYRSGDELMKLIGSYMYPDPGLFQGLSMSRDMAFVNKFSISLEKLIRSS